MRNWRHEVTMTLFSMSVMCIAPATWPQTMSEFLMFLRYKAAKGAPFAVGGERSTMHLRRFDTVPELVVAWEADGGRMTWRSSCFDMVTLVAFEKDGLRIPVPPFIPSIPSSSTLSNAASGCFLSSFDDFLSSVEATGDLLSEVLDAGCCDGASSEALLLGTTERFLRALN